LLSRLVFASDRANRVVGTICGLLTFTPFDDWRRAHAAHHATAGDLDRRGTGDVWTMTVEEYLAAPPRRRLAYRFLRNPVVLLGLVPATLSSSATDFRTGVPGGGSAAAFGSPTWRWPGSWERQP